MGVVEMPGLQPIAIGFLIILIEREASQLHLSFDSIRKHSFEVL